MDAQRDWGYAKDFVRMMWLMLQQDRADDFVVGTGHTYEVEEFVEAAFSHVDLDWHDYVVIDPRFYRPAEVDLLVADPSKAKRDLSWQTSVEFRELVAMMVDADLAELSAGDDTARPHRQAA